MTQCKKKIPFLKIVFENVRGRDGVLAPNCVPRVCLKLLLGKFFAAINI